jgi:hypothetical protein
MADIKRLKKQYKEYWKEFRKGNFEKADQILIQVANENNAKLLGYNK